MPGLATTTDCPCCGVDLSTVNDYEAANGLRYCLECLDCPDVGCCDPHNLPEEHWFDQSWHNPGCNHLPICDWCGERHDPWTKPEGCDKPEDDN